MPITVRVKLFASYADAVGERELSLQLTDGARVDDALARIREFARGQALPPKPLVAVNTMYATLAHELGEGDELAIIPPVAGG